MKTINTLIRKHTAFKGALDLVKSSRQPYRPTLQALGPADYSLGDDLTDDEVSQIKAASKEIKTIADFYDAAMQRRGNEKRAYRIHA